MTVYDSAHALAGEIKASIELKDFKELHHAVMANENTKAMVTDFQSKQFEIQAAQFSGQEIDPIKLNRIKELYEVISKDPLIKEYLQAEMRFGQMMSDVSKIISDAVELD